MTEIVNNSIRGEMMEIIKTKFEALSFWERIESDIASMCSEFPEPDTKENTIIFVEKLKSLKKFLHEEEVSNEDLSFIDDEIDLHKGTKIISLYEEQDDSISQDMINAYSRLGKDSEGIVSISQKLNYEQLIKLSNGVFQKTGLVKFFISEDKIIHGKITASMYNNTAQEIPIATVVQTKKRDRDTGDYKKSIIMFGKKKANEMHFDIIKEINIPFYIYRFLTDKNMDIILLTVDKHEVGDYVVSGVETKCNDFKALTESAKIMTKLPYIFAQSLKNRIINYENHDQFKKRLKELKISKENLFDIPFTVDKNGKTWKLIQPTWYKWFIWSWLTHQSKGMMNNYPMHIIQVAQKASGKSVLLNSLYSRSKESREIFSGAGSTLKSLVPSFKYTIPQIGYLAESSRFSFCDEFLRCLTRSKTHQEGGAREEAVAMMNDLLEHQKREVGSGIGRVDVHMTSRIIAMTNPVRDMYNLQKLLHGFDESFLSRWLIYYQTDDHIQMIRRSNDSDLKEHKYKINSNDWVSLLDYLHTFSAKYDMKRVEKIHEDTRVNLTEDLNKHYDARHKHHIECLMDGIIKSRCMMEIDMEFKATEEDYKILETVWKSIISSWLDTSKIKNIPINERIYYLPENSQFLYWKICEEKKLISHGKCKEIALTAMSKKEMNESFQILIDMEMISNDDGAIKPYYISSIKDKNQQGLFTGD